MLDDGMPRAATELLRLAIEEDPEQRALWLVLLGRAIADANAAEFAELAAAFAKQFPGDGLRDEVSRIDHALSRPGPAESLPMEPPPGWNAASQLGRNSAGQAALHRALAAAQSRGAP
jgi:hypothetical protein